MKHPKATVVLERQGETSAPQCGLSGDALVRAVVDLDGCRDVTLTISAEGVDDRLMVAVDGSLAFLGLERPDGLLQFVDDSRSENYDTRPFMIGGQESEIEVRYLPELQTAALVVEEWLEGGEATTRGHWERQ